jgi:uncharacterized membrane protein
MNTATILCTIAIALAAACTIAREGSTIIDYHTPTATNATVTITAAANGATAQHAGNHSNLGARAQAQQSLSPKAWTWIVLGALAAAAIWFIWRFVFTSARLTILKP